MAIVMSNNFEGEAGDNFLGDATYSVAGSVGLVASHYGVAARFSAGTSGYLEQTFNGTSFRVFSRIYRIAAAPTGHSQIFQARSATAPLFTVSIRTTGSLSLHSGGSISSALTNTPGPIPMGKEFRVVYLVNSTQVTASIFPDISSTEALYTISATVPGGAMTQTREGSPAGPEGVAIDLAWPLDESAADPGPRQYVYMTPSATSGVIPKTITATVNSENLPSGTKAYSINWGDGSSSGPQSSNSFSHTFSKMGAWKMVPKVEVG